MNIVFFSPNRERAQQWADNLKARGLTFDAQYWDSDAVPTGNGDGDYAVVWLPPEQLFQHHTRLKAVFNVGAGADAILKLRSLPEHVNIVRLDDEEIGSKMAEYVLYMVARITRRMDGYTAAQAGKAWAPAPYTYFEDWPIGLMGLGKIGQQIAGLLSSLGYPVNGWARSPRDIKGVTSYHGADQFAGFLAASRIVVNVLPLTADTTGILNMDTFRRMPQGSYVVNIGRGEHLDETALRDALDQGLLAGAVLDVFQEEPLPPGHPFWADGRIHITPHISGATNLKQAMKQIAGKIRALQEGQAISGIVDRRAGY